MSRVDVIRGDMRQVLATMAASSVDACACDPPYHLTSTVKRFGSQTAAPARSTGATGVFKRSSAGFMGKTWDGGDIAFQAETWAAVRRVLKPGAHLVAFGHGRTFHRMVVAIEAAGFEIRDLIGWTYGSGFPKSHDQGGGLGTALKPALEPICLARKPLIGSVRQNLDRYGTGALNIDACRIEAARWPANLAHDGSDEAIAAFPVEAGAGGSAARFFYKAKATKAERIFRCTACGQRSAGRPACGCLGEDGKPAAADSHPTVKPIDLMRWLVRLVTPAGGLVLDPFAGTGTTGRAALDEGRSAVLIEAECEYFADIQKRLGAEPTAHFHVASPWASSRSAEAAE